MADVYIQDPPLNSGFGFTFIKAAGGKMIDWETRIKHSLCAQQTVVLRAEESLGSQRSSPTAWPAMAHDMIVYCHSSINQKEQR